MTGMLRVTAVHSIQLESFAWTEMEGIDQVVKSFVGVFKDYRRPIPQTAQVVKVLDNVSISQTSILSRQ